MELRYIINNSEASILMSSAKFQERAAEVIKEGLDNPPVNIKIDKRLVGSDSPEQVQLNASPGAAGGIMLYTSGTTSRPVKHS